MNEIAKKVAKLFLPATFALASGCAATKTCLPNGACTTSYKIEAPVIHNYQSPYVRPYYRPVYREPLIHIFPHSRHGYGYHGRHRGWFHWGSDAQDAIESYPAGGLNPETGLAQIDIRPNSNVDVSMNSEESLFTQWDQAVLEGSPSSLCPMTCQETLTAKSDSGQHFKNSM